MLAARTDARAFVASLSSTDNALQVISEEKSGDKALHEQMINIMIES